MGSLDMYLTSFSDPDLEALLEDDSSFLTFDSRFATRLLQHLPDRQARGQPTFIDNIYSDRDKPFKYIVWDANKATMELPRQIVSSIPPHITIGRSIRKLCQHRLSRSATRRRRLWDLFYMLYYLPHASPRPEINQVKPSRVNARLITLGCVFRQWLFAKVPSGFITGIPNAELSEESEGSEGYPSTASASDDEDTITDSEQSLGSTGKTIYVVRKPACNFSKFRVKARREKRITNWVHEVGRFEMDDKFLFDADEVEMVQHDEAPSDVKLNLQEPYSSPESSFSTPVPSELEGDPIAITIDNADISESVLHASIIRQPGENIVNLKSIVEMKDQCTERVESWLCDLDCSDPEMDDKSTCADAEGKAVEAQAMA
ncbi:hypothetical protein MIND_00991600 [Mycena indigotica]|uniref:Uncharacterized protein n=1 Tax=Mycena indigotica TaxID=2126181 RepID=A0A8H6S9E1_9AGAR|nr:uncharacterized protein MIND_00991600 [Mycena indigotica]KAF7294551.1 hypothetical protein MIND_00991600 [Mycena indigotica]